MPLLGTGRRGRRPRRGAPDTLPLPLPAGSASGPPARLPLEQPLDVAAPFDGADWRFSVDWEGMRVVVEADGDGAARLHDERLHDAGAVAAEVLAAVPGALRGRRAVLEGVLVLLDGEGRPDLAALFARVARLATAPAGAPAGGPAPVLLVTDLLGVDGALRLDRPFDRRREALAELVEAAPHVQLPAWLEGHGIALCEAAAERGIPLVAARHAGGSYLPGLPSPQRLRVTVAGRADTVVVGAVARRELTELLLAEWDGDRLVEAGRVAVEGTAATRGWLECRVAGLAAEQPVIAGAAALVGDQSAIAGGADHSGVRWLRPSLVATVSHQGRGPDGRPRLPALLALREDRPVRLCMRQAPRPVPAGAGEAELPGFRPTVISTLPFAEA